MPTLASFLISIAGSLAARVFIALGISAVTFTGLSAALTSLTNQLQSQYNGLPAATLQMAGLAGFGHFFAIMTSAMVARLAVVAVKRFRPM